MRLLGIASRRHRKTERGATTGAPAADTYLTDGKSLFRVARTHLDLNHDALVELEDCRTLELVLLPARHAMGLGLRPVGLPQ